MFFIRLEHHSQHMEVLDAIKARRSIRKFEDRPIEKEKLDLIADAGRLAPSAMNEKRVRAVFAIDREEIGIIAEACDPFSWVSSAPCVIAVYADNDRTMKCGISSKVVDCSIALTNMMLEATALGLGTVWMGHFDSDMVKRALAIPEDAVRTASMPVGYPAEEGTVREKAPREVFASFDAARSGE